eukprot:SAG11_NODE_75_length_18024_cov_5.885356_9_plen_134_part_00
MANAVPASTVDALVDTFDPSHPFFTAGSSGVPNLAITQTGGSSAHAPAAVATPAPALAALGGPAPAPDLATLAAEMAAMRAELDAARAAAVAAPSAVDIERRVEFQLQQEINKINSGFSSRLLSAPKLDKAEQ